MWTRTVRGKEATTKYGGATQIRRRHTPTHFARFQPVASLGCVPALRPPRNQGVILIRNRKHVLVQSADRHQMPAKQHDRTRRGETAAHNRVAHTEEVVHLSCPASWSSFKHDAVGGNVRCRSLPAVKRMRCSDTGVTPP